MHKHESNSGLKQSNKAHKKVGHVSKSIKKNRKKGRLQISKNVLAHAHAHAANGNINSNSNSNSNSSNRKRRNLSKQVRSNKLQELEVTKNVLGTRDGPPKVIAFIPLGNSTDVQSLFQSIVQHPQHQVIDEFRHATVLNNTINNNNNNNNNTAFSYDFSCQKTLWVSKCKQKITVLAPPPTNERNFIINLDMAKVADVIVYIVTAADGVDDDGRRLLSLIRTQGLPAATICLQGLDAFHIKHRHQLKKECCRFFESQFKDVPKVFTVDDDGIDNFIRHCCVQKLFSVKWRDIRPRLLVEKLSFTPTASANDSSNIALGTLSISGCLRGTSISANDLVHIPDFGDFQLIAVERHTNLHFHSHDQNNNNNNTEGATTIVEYPDPNLQESLASEIPLDLNAGEQTWPTQEEIDEATYERRKVPKGTSEYQSAWISQDDADDDEGDDGNEGEDDDEDEEEEEEEEDGMHASNHKKQNNKKTELQGDGWELQKRNKNKSNNDNNADEDEDDDDDDDDDEGMDLLEEDDDDDDDEGDVDVDVDDVADDVAEKAKLADEDMLFPDEVDTPIDIPARVRFAKFRGLQSFRSSTWDPKENLPLDYARIFQFENFLQTRKAVLKNQETLRVIEDDQGKGYVTLHIANVPSNICENLKEKILVIGGILQHENKTTVLNFDVEKWPEYQDPVRSKEPMVFHFGFRRYPCRPIYSQNNLNSDKHKYEKFLHEGRHDIATIYGPATFAPMPLLVFSPLTGKLVATGSLRSCDVDRLIIKRVILTGYVFKVNKKTIITRFMFFNPEDVRWFQKVQLWTKHGRTGHIRMPVGTHGRCKCMFDGVVQQNDTICMSLYKRVFPKWIGSPSHQSTN